MRRDPLAELLDGPPPGASQDPEARARHKAAFQAQVQPANSPPVGLSRRWLATLPVAAAAGLALGLALRRPEPTWRGQGGVAAPTLLITGEHLQPLDAVRVEVGSGLSPRVSSRSPVEIHLGGHRSAAGARVVPWWVDDGGVAGISATGEVAGPPAPLPDGASGFRLVPPGEGTLVIAIVADPDLDAPALAARLRDGGVPTDAPTGGARIVAIRFTARSP